MKIHLNWSKIDNEKVFQRLSNHLFLYECNRTYFIPSSPYIGKDGGWDGRYEGEYEGDTGLFSIQAKWTLKNFDAAEKELQAAITKEVSKAKKQKIDHLVVQEESDIEKLVWNQYLESSFLPERGSGYEANTSCRGAV